MGDFFDATPDNLVISRLDLEGDANKTTDVYAELDTEKIEHSSEYLNEEITNFSNGQHKFIGKEGVGTDPGAASSESEIKAVPVVRRKMVGTLEIFRFADKKDRAMMIVGTICALMQGTAMPIVFVIFGNMTDLFVNNAELNNYIESILPNLTVCSANITYEWVTKHQQELQDCLIQNNMTDILTELNRLYQGSLLDQMRDIALIYVYLGIAVIICGYIEMACWQLAAANQCQRIRSKLLQSILSQDIGWFDTHEIGELHSRLVDDVDQIEAGIGDKMALFFQYFCAFIAGFIIGFVKGWQLTLVMLSVTPLLAVSAAVVNKLAAMMARKEQDAYAKAGSVAEEVLGAIRTVAMFGGQEKECIRYNDRLLPSRKFGINKGWVTGIGIGAVFFLLFASYALAFWYGSDLVRTNPAYTAGVLTTVFFAIIVGSFSLGNAAPQIQDFANARGAAYEVYRLIDLESSIDNNSIDGRKPEKVRGDIEFKNVKFSYPSRKDVPILREMSFKVNVGQTCALVGSSGCGKSTTVQILQRFYDILDGQVLIDGINIKEWNIDYLRRQIGVVSQEPILFATTIAENIKYGRQNATVEDVVMASKKANAHEFITKLPDKYDTLVGERGAQLSGGQKQRIAIARALVRDPKILLLDEATSALDTQSESTVQIALDQARQGRTTIIIAHRLSTVRTADYILGVAEGKVVEQGNHQELMQLGKLYYNLVTSQTSGDQEKKDPVDFIPTGDYIFSRQLSTVSNKSTKSTGAEVLKIVKIKEAQNVDMMRLMKMNQPEWIFILIAALMATINGCVQPCFAFIFSEILSVFAIQDLEEQKKKTDFLSAMFLVIGIVSSLSAAIMHGMFGYTGENLTFRLRKLVFKILLQQDIGYFDDATNTTGALCSRLSTDASLVRGAAGSRIGYLIQGIAAIGLGLIIGFVYSWQLTLVVLCFAPLTLMSGFVQSKVVRRGGGTDKKMENASSIAIEAIENIRTVTSLSLQELSLDKYCAEMTSVYKGKKRSAHVISVAYAVSQSVIFFADAACFTFGAYLIQNAGLQYDDMFKVFLAVIMGAQAAGRATSFAPDYGKAKSAAARLFSLFDRVPAIDISSETGKKLDKFFGKMDFSQIEFSYPSRPKVKVLRGVDFNVEPGTRVALVGSSGCGKSTTMQLLQRFYDPTNGCIKVDGVRIDSLNLPWWRAQLGLVSQEPILFDCSIRENIAYGDNSREIPIDEIEDAAKKANIHNFIKDLPKGYETSAGDKGAQLSGGQKQRIAIARALVRNPKILLLDEATSALDMESEKIVQDALDKAQEGRTSLVIAHRLSTIQNSDKIFVFHNGKIVESGTHTELLENQGLYHKLYTVSSITATSA